MTRDYYAVLGVPRDASQEEIRAARRARLREAHPDANPGDPTAAERFDLICKAGEVLAHPERRRLYDDSLRGFTRGDAPGARMKCRTCDGSGAIGFIVCGWCEGLGRTGMGFTNRCADCEGTGRLPDPCFRCDGKGWRYTTPPPRRPAEEKPRPEPPPSGRTFYEVLGVAQDASAARISEAYRDIVRAEGKPIPERVKSAYRRIGDPRRRAGYDRGLGLPTKGRADDVDVHVSPRLARQGAASHAFTVPDRELCPNCEGVGRILLPCGNCQGRGYWRWGGAATRCDACRGRGTDERACFRCALSGWVDAARTVTCRIPSGAAENSRITVRDDLLGVATLRLRLALVPEFARRDR